MPPLTPDRAAIRPVGSPGTGELRCARIALPVPVDECFTYSVPPTLADRVVPGVRVRVPFGSRRLTGFVIEVVTGEALPGPLKPVLEVLDAEPVAGVALRELCRWTADYYFASLGEVLACAVPAAAPGGRRVRGQVLRLTQEVTVADVVGRSVRRQELVERLRASPDGIPRKDLPSDAARLLRPLLAAGAVAWHDAEPRTGHEPGPEPQIALNASQRVAVDVICGALRLGQFSPFLLLGVTGSGKTEVYLRAAAEAVDQGRSVLYLVPEIGLTPLLARQFLGRFGARVAVLHSGLGRPERWREWSRVARGEATVVLGTRSAIFAPLERPGLIVVDEEQESSFKQEERPRYNARDLALVRARSCGAVVVLGSATPSMETYHHARTGKYQLLELRGRVKDRPLARSEVVDMRAEFRRRGEAHVLSDRLLEALRERVRGGEQSVLLLNRRGYATFVLCRECGTLATCPRCSVTLVHHRAEGRLRCHYCGHARGYPRTCDACGGHRLHAGGEGTERLEESLAERLPEARVVRLDRDVVRRQGEAERILAGFGRGDWDVLLGTQMVAKGHDFPRVTLVGVLGADGTLGLPDFRAAERTFQLLTQVAGRSGRGNRPGQVLIQTFQPEHYAIRHAQIQDTAAFYAEEIRFRRLMQYPPFTVLANLIVSRVDPGAAHQQAEALAAAISREGGEFVRVLGPAPAPLARLRGRHRVQLLLKARARGRLADSVRAAIEMTPGERSPTRHLMVDIDPVSLR